MMDSSLSHRRELIHFVFDLAWSDVMRLWWAARAWHLLVDISSMADTIDVVVVLVCW